MKIAEIFYSIQGEGELTGMPSVFVRTSGCNLRCNWCDTPYSSWSPTGTQMGAEQILGEVQKYPTKYAVLTGGEPMMAKGIHDLAACLREHGYHITIETAGTLVPSEIACDLASLSPKLSNSSPDNRLPKDWRDKHEKRRIQLDVLRQWVDRYQYQLKFVVVSDQDMGEIEDTLMAIERPIQPSRVLLMPEGRDLNALKERAGMLVELCKRRGYRFCNRLHIELFGNKRGT